MSPLHRNYNLQTDDKLGMCSLVDWNNARRSWFNGRIQVDSIRRCNNVWVNYLYVC